MAKSKTRLKCTEKAFCAELDARVNATEGGRTKGFVVGTIFQFSTGKMFPSPIWYTDAGSEDPLYVKFCPFCGTNFAPRLKKFKQAMEKAHAERVKSGKPPVIEPRRPKIKRKSA